MKHILLSVFVFATLLGNADEGMFLPFQLKKYKKELKNAGLELSVKEIYHPKKPSVKDAIVSLGGFCTGEIISPKGLMLTNHHCGYDAIRENSTPENDYLTDGFWAKDLSEEKPIPGLTASIVVRMEDVSKKINKNLSNEMTEDERKAKIRELSETLSSEAVEGTSYTAEVKPFYEGNEFYLFVYEIFEDVRLVGAPPSAIGKYGGDTDNWMWERHTGDFSMFRIYANAANEAAPFAMDNKPYTPRHHLPISLAGVKEGDFSMIMGFPGSTDRYLTSYGVKMAVEKDQPSRVKIRGKKLDIMKADMAASDEVRLQYASTYAQVSNYWKYFIGQTEQLKNNNVLQKKQAIETEFAAWVNEKSKRQERYGNVLADMESAYVKLNELNPLKVYFFEAVYSVGINQFMIQHTRLYNLLGAAELDEEAIKKQANRLAESSDAFYETFNAETERKIIAKMLKLYYNDVPESQHTEVLDRLAEENDADFKQLVADAFRSSVFTNENRYDEFIKNPTLTQFENEPLFLLSNSMLESYRTIMFGAEAQAANAKLDRANRLFVEALREMYPNKNYYPNANFSLRLSYGNILSYSTTGGKKYPYYTTMKGLMAKEDPTNPEFIVPSKLKELYTNQNYGKYAEDGELHVNFISNNDITGGNSGSPVMNAKGELIGCAFDGNWEAMSGDIAFEDELQRTISADIRYILFVIDKYADASHLIDEMTIVE